MGDIPVTPYEETTVSEKALKEALGFILEYGPNRSFVGKSVRVIEYQSLDGDAVFSQWVEEFERRFPCKSEQEPDAIVDAVQLVYDELGRRQLVYLVDIGFEQRYSVEEVFGKEVMYFVPDTISGVDIRRGIAPERGLFKFS